MNKRIRRQISAYSVAAGAAALGAASTAEAALKVYDHRTAPLYAYVDYWNFDQALAVLNVKTGDFQYVQDNGATISRYNQDGFVDNNPIPESAKTNDTVWFSHRDMDIDIQFGAKAADGVYLETPTGGAGGQLDPKVVNVVYTPSGGTANRLYWANQTFDADGNPVTPDATWALPLPSDSGDPLPPVAVDGSLDYNDSSTTGYTGVLTHGFGGLGHGSGTDFGVEAYPGSSSFSVGFKLQEIDGPHYGWVAMHVDYDRNRIRDIYGWGYQTAPGVAAQLSWVGDSGNLPGDFDNDGDVDADDIDLLCDNLGDSAYDLDGDNDADEDDMTYLVENLVELQDGRIGTKRGDFNLDGLINATDLAVMNSSFGQSGIGYAAGNANCDDLVNATDLAILGANFGYVAPPAGAVPEPVTLSLLALGAGGVLANRRKR